MLLFPGYWPSTYWSKSYWIISYWPNYARWLGIINGVTNPAKINGIAVADIAKVCGI